MHAIDWVMSSMLSLGTTYSRSGIGCLLISQGVTRWIFFQWNRVHVDDQILDHRHVAHRLDRDHPTALAAGLRRTSEMGVARQPRLVVDPHPAGAADRRLAGAADADRAIALVAPLENRVEHRAMAVEVDSELLPVGPLSRLRVIPTQPQGVLSHRGGGSRAYGSVIS
jgi:hypothetical protein